MIILILKLKNKNHFKKIDIIKMVGKFIYLNHYYLFFTIEISSFFALSTFSIYFNLFTYILKNLGIFVINRKIGFFL